MIVLGIDPGTISTGYAVLKATDRAYTPLDFGCITPPPLAPLNERYCIIFDSISHIIDKFNPKALAIETQFFGKNAQSAIKLAMARGVAIVASSKKGLSVHEYTPLKAKCAVANGKASKEQVQASICLLLGLKDINAKSDAYDALALAICHLHTLRL